MLAIIGCFIISAAPAAAPSERTQKLIAVLQSNAPFFDKARACQQLGEIGTREAVPALAALLADEHLSAYARSGLEGIPDPSAAAALRSALGTLKGPRLAGAINSLGVLCDAQAVGPLRQLAADPGSGVVKEVLLALGAISTAESIEILRQTLTGGPEQFRPDAAAACLLAAERQRIDGNADQAKALFDAVRNARVPSSYRGAATRGAILARKADRAAFLIEQLRSGESTIRNAAFLTIREIPDDQLAAALNAELGKAKPELLLQLLAALADCHNAQSAQAIQPIATGEDVALRKTALTVLGQIGSPYAADVLLAALAAERSPEECSLAANALSHMEGTTVDDLCLKALPRTAGAAARVHLIRLLDSRGVTNAAGELLRQAAISDSKVSLAAFSALKSLAGPEELPRLIALTRAGADETVREAAENAVAGVCAKSGRGSPGAEAVLAELKQTTGPALRNSWIRILITLGYPNALPDIKAALSDPNEAVASNALQHLGRWPDPAPMDDLLSAMESGASPRLRQRALVSVIDLATTATDEEQRPEATITAWLQRAGQAARSVEDKRRIISLLGRLKTSESFRLLVPYLDAADLRTEAALAVVQIAPALAQSEGPALKPVLEKIAATTDKPDLRNRARDVAQTIPAQRAPVSLFDGRSLAGWNGGTKVWRVRDGVIVGGSLNGNPRNEFLAAARSYTNFVLRLEYKLAGTEGFINSGVQFRSVHVAQPPNEMSGYQADIGAGHSGCLYDESRRNKFLARAADEQIKRLEEPGSWNRYEVRCQGPHIQIMLNGEKTVDYTETDSAIPQDGLIALQIHGGCKAEVSFRNITVEEQ